MLTAMLQKFSISTRAKKPNTMARLATEMQRDCVTHGMDISSEGLGAFLVIYVDSHYTCVSRGC